MPIYEYICESCQHHTELLQKMSDPPLAACPACGGPVYRPISRTSFQLKGGGWYKDGYGSAKPAESAEKKSEGPPPAATTEGKKESAAANTGSDTPPVKKASPTDPSTPS